MAEAVELPAWYFDLAGFIKVRAATEEEAAEIADKWAEAVPAEKAVVRCSFGLKGPNYLVDPNTGARIDT